MPGWSELLDRCDDETHEAAILLTGSNWLSIKGCWAGTIVNGLSLAWVLHEVMLHADRCGRLARDGPGRVGGQTRWVRVVRCAG